MVIPAAWMQETFTISSGNTKLIIILLMIFIGLIAISLVVQAVVLIGLSRQSVKAIKEMSVIAADIKAKALPLIASVSTLTATVQTLLNENTSKIRIITDNLVDTSKIVKAQVQQLDKTVTDVNQRTAVQVARVDGMVTSALETTSEIVESVNNGIRVPARKIAIMITEAKFVLEGIFDKLKSKAAGLPFMR